MNLTQDHGSLTLLVDLASNYKVRGLDKMVSTGPTQLYDVQIPLILCSVQEGSDKA